MHPDTREIAGHMQALSLAALGRAGYDLTFSQNMHSFASVMAIGEAGHGAELALKARIAQEHPLLLFETLPASKHAAGELTITELFEHGRTVQFSDLPELLWATTGYRMSAAHLKQYVEFGKLRNGVIHFALPPHGDWRSQTLKFLFEVMEPLVQHFWKESIVHATAEWDEVALDGHLEEQLKQADVIVTPGLQELLDAGVDGWRTS